MNTTSGGALLIGRVGRASGALSGVLSVRVGRLDSVFSTCKHLPLLNPYSDEAGRLLRLKPLATLAEKGDGKKPVKGKLKPGRVREILDDIPGEGFSELDPAVLALEEADQHVLLGLAAFELPDLCSLGNVSAAFWTDDFVELAWQL